MIQANEIRIGNLVTTILGEDIKAVTGIKTHKVIDGLLLTVCVDYDKDPLSFLQEHLFPVPLSPSILEKCGFVQREGDAIYRHYKRYISVSKFGRVEYTSSGQCIVNEIKYLHQLQNLFFCLTGNEIEITL